jgi:hypothetical protein
MNIKLKLTLALLLTCFFQSSNAQEISLVGGMSITNMSTKDNDGNYAKEGNFKSRIGGHFGALLGFNLSESIALQTGLLFSTKGYRQVEKETIDEDNKYKVVGILKLSYLEVPLLVSYNYSVKDNIKIYAGLGPVLGIAVGGKYVEKGTWTIDGEKESEKESEKISFGNNENRDGIKRLDLGLIIQAGVQYEKYKFGLFYNQGLMNVSPYNDNGFSVKNKAFGLSVAYVIDLKK